jgi:hypothetical protein
MDRHKYSNVDPIEKKNLSSSDQISKANDQWSKIRSKIEAVVWVVVFFVVYHKTRIIKEMFTNPKINQLFLKLFLVGFGVNFMIIIFVAVVLPLWGFDRYEDYSSQITPFGSVIMLISFLSAIISVYPVYGILSILIIPILGMGFLMISQFIPLKGNLNSLVLFAIFSVLLVYGYYFH